MAYITMTPAGMKFMGTKKSYINYNAKAVLDEYGLYVGVARVSMKEPMGVETINLSSLCMDFSMKPQGAGMSVSLDNLYFYGSLENLIGFQGGIRSVSQELIETIFNYTDKAISKKGKMAYDLFELETSPGVLKIPLQEMDLRSKQKDAILVLLEKAPTHIAGIVENLHEETYSREAFNFYPKYLDEMASKAGKYHTTTFAKKDEKVYVSTFPQIMEISVPMGGKNSFR